MEIGEMSLLVQKFGAKNQIPLVDRLWQAESRLERSFTRAQRELERLQKSRPRQTSQPAEAAPAPQPAESVVPVNSPSAASDTVDRPENPGFIYTAAPPTA